MLFAYMAAAQNMNDNSGVGICHPMSPQTPFWRHIGMKNLLLHAWYGMVAFQCSDRKHETAQVKPPVATSSHMATLQSAAPKRPQRTPDASYFVFLKGSHFLCSSISDLERATHPYLIRSSDSHPVTNSRHNKVRQDQEQINQPAPQSQINKVGQHSWDVFVGFTFCLLSLFFLPGLRRKKTGPAVYFLYSSLFKKYLPTNSHRG